MTKKIADAEKETLDGLRRAGFELDFGPDGAGIARAYFTRGGGYYIDVGCSQLIIDGKIKVNHNPGGINGFGNRELLLANGDSLPADVVVLATGYDNMRTTVRKVLGDKIADRCSDVWDLDAEGEVQAVSCHLLISRLSLVIFPKYMLIKPFRCGAPVVILASGTSAETLPCVGSTPGFWHFRSRLSSLEYQKAYDSRFKGELHSDMLLRLCKLHWLLNGRWILQL